MVQETTWKSHDSWRRKTNWKTVRMFGFQLKNRPYTVVHLSPSQIRFETKKKNQRKKLTSCIQLLFTCQCCHSLPLHFILCLSPFWQADLKDSSWNTLHPTHNPSKTMYALHFYLMQHLFFVFTWMASSKSFLLSKAKWTDMIWTPLVIIQFTVIAGKTTVVWFG